MLHLTFSLIQCDLPMTREYGKIILYSFTGWFAKSGKMLIVFSYCFNGIVVGGLTGAKNIITYNVARKPCFKEQLSLSIYAQNIYM